MGRYLSVLLLLLPCILAARAAQVAVAGGGNPAVVPTPRTEPWWVARHVERIALAKAGGVDLLFVGDSITQNYEKPGPAPDEVFRPIWDEYFAPHHAFNLGYSGDQTQHVLWRLQHGEVDGLAPKDVVLLIGTNNTDDHPVGSRAQTTEEVTAGVAAVVEELRLRLPGAKILVIEILPSAVSPEKSAKDEAVNRALRGRFEGSSSVRCLDLSSLFLKDGSVDAALYYDSRLKTPRKPLHPDIVGQRMMAKTVTKALYGVTQ